PHSSTAFEDYWVVWDRRLLHQWGLKPAIESLGPILPNILELSYLLVYVVPVVTVLIFYRCRSREKLDDAYSILLFGTLTAYALYPYFPSEPPRTVFPQADLPLLSALRFRGTADRSRAS
ncbi:MAG: phosphatase PAP2 family protein, partial [Deltaproteobacteria bacterium]|nr:phosphatase PAP2 family protein [Deltaproteobacteria bacterium]